MEEKKALDKVAQKIKNMAFATEKMKELSKKIKAEKEGH